MSTHRETSVSLNPATGMYEVWGVDKYGNAGIIRICSEPPPNLK